MIFSRLSRPNHHPPHHHATIPQVGLNARLFAIALLALSTCFFFIFVFQYRQPLDADSLEYDTIAWNFAQGRGLVYNGAPYVTRPPSYIIFVGLLYSVLGHAPYVVLYVQVLMYIGACLILYFIARTTSTEEVATLAGPIIATYFPLAYYTSVIVTEVFIILVMTISIFAAIKYVREYKLKYLIVCGIGLGIGILSKPILLLFPCCIVGYFAFKGFSVRKLLSSAGILALITASVLSLWVTRNYLVFGEFILLSKGNLGSVMLRSVLDHDHKYLLWNDVHTWRMEGSNDPRKAVSDEIDAKIAREVRLDARKSEDILYIREAFELISEDPLTYAAGSLVRIARLWISYPTRSRTPLKIIVGLYDVILISLALVGIAVSWKRWRELSILWLPLLYITFVHIPLHVEARYSAPMKPYLLIFAAIGAVRIIRQRLPLCVTC